MKAVRVSRAQTRLVSPRPVGDRGSLEQVAAISAACGSRQEARRGFRR